MAKCFECPKHPPSRLQATMEIPPHLQERTQDLLQELGSGVGKDVANQFITECSAIYYRDNDLPVIDPRIIMGPGSPGGDDSWQRQSIDACNDTCCRFGPSH